MAKETTVARESGVSSLNTRNAQTNSTRRLKGWNNTYAPKNKSVKVLDWLKDNDFHTGQTEEDMIGNKTFKEYKFDYSHDALDTFIRDAIYDGLQSLKRKR